MNKNGLENDTETDSNRIRRSFLYKFISITFISYIFVIVDT